MSIAETDRLVLESDMMLRRHHQECDDDASNGAGTFVLT